VTADEIRRIGYRVVDLIAEHLTTLPDGPVFQPFPDALGARLQAERVPADGASADDILRDFRDIVAPYPFGNGHPRFWGWVNSPPAVMGIFADALAAAMNPSCAGGNHAAIHVERQVIAWLRELVGFPDGAMGLLVSGGSMATLTALAVARHVKCGVDVRAAGLRTAPQPFRFYQSPEGHSAARKAVELLGFGSDAIRIVPTDADRCMNVDELDRAIAEDVAAGVRPIAVIASAGTVNSGAIDPLAGIAGVCARRDIWLHVDAAYGGPAILTDEYRDRLAALALADSVALDPHKWMYVPVEAGFVLVRDAAAMRDAFSLVPPYIRSRGSASAVMGAPWFSEYGFQQTRGFRALKVWMCLKAYGLTGYKAAIERNIALARYLAARVRHTPELELMAPPSLSIVCFRYVGAKGVDPAATDPNGRLDALNRSVLERLQLGGEAFISSTELEGRFALRACVVNHRSTTADVDRLIGAVLELGSSVYEPS
jgi:aromatic-L-amino-acid/L-tryptophan decarboxylase